MSYSSDLVRTKDWQTETLTDADLESQFDLIINWVMAAMDGTTGHAHTGAANQGPKITLTAGAGVTGTLPVTNGGTGQATVAAFLGLIYPIGCIYAETTGVNPATTFGFGTWAAYAAGRVLVGVGTSDAVYAAAAIGGASTHALSEAELAAHTHSVAARNNGGTGSGSDAYGTGGSISTGSTGSGTAHENMPPYVVTYYWTRTA